MVPRARIQDPLRADDGIRTRDPHLGKVMRYQLRYVRMLPTGLGPVPRPGASRTVADPGSPDQPGSGQIVGDHLIERIVDIHPQGLVAGQDDVVAGVQELGQPLRAGLEHGVA